MNVFSIAFSLFLLMNPIGNLPLFISILKDIPLPRQRFIIFRELVIALLVMTLFNFLGNAILSSLHISTYSVLISGGIILFLIALKMIFPLPKEHGSNKKLNQEPFIVPLAIPMVAGPAVLASILLYSGNILSSWITLEAILLAWAAAVPILLSASWLQKFLGSRGVVAIERLFGLILTMLSIQMLLAGIMQYYRTLPHA